MLQNRDESLSMRSAVAAIKKEVIEPTNARFATTVGDLNKSLPK